MCKILRVFLNTLTPDDKYSLLNRQSLTKPIQMNLSQKQESFSEFSFVFSKFTLNFENFEKKDDPHSLCIYEITDSEGGG